MEENQNLRIVFMGTPEFAVLSLRKLVEENFNIVAVVTAPDKPQGRGKKLGTSAIKEYAEANHLNILQPTNLKDPAFLESLRSLQADLQVVVAFRMLPEAVWSMPRLGAFNLHASLLPQYRGAAPINWAIINGERETGVTTFQLDAQIDTGNIIFQETEPIHQQDTAGSLYERLMEKGANLVLKTVRAFQNNTVSLKPQKAPETIKHAPKIFRETCEINWKKTTDEIRNFIRGLSPYPAAWTHLDGKMVKIYEGKSSEKKPEKRPGEWETDGKNFLVFKTGDGVLELCDVQMEGKKRMKIDEFLRGFQQKTAL